VAALAGVDVVFDLDGTLTDPVVGITRCIQHALAALGESTPPSSTLARFVGPPLRGTFATLLGTEDEEILSKAIRLYRERFEAVGMLENAPYPDVPGMLEALRRRSHRLWVATSKPEIYAKQILEHFGLDRSFERIYGSELSGHNSDKADLLRCLLRTEDLVPASVCMVGDRAQDVLAAHENGVTAVAVLWGYGTMDELEAAAPHKIVRSAAELCEYLSGRWPKETDDL